MYLQCSCLPQKAEAKMKRKDMLIHSVVHVFEGGALPAAVALRLRLEL